ncbi:MAG: hypothetical protein IH840_02620 [Candidatus Heimdallarchaeota archaeon]|nr:hypothetical protein [Candidatus Heimdallarchaeota archaeon]
MSVVLYPNANNIKITGKVNINFQFPPSFQFVGTQEIIVKDIARATQYSFVQIDHKTIEKMILVQHEMFLPKKMGATIINRRILFLSEE